MWCTPNWNQLLFVLPLDHFENGCLMSPYGLIVWPRLLCCVVGVRLHRRDCHWKVRFSDLKSTLFGKIEYRGSYEYISTADVQLFSQLCLRCIGTRVKARDCLLWSIQNVTGDSNLFANERGLLLNYFPISPYRRHKQLKIEFPRRTSRETFAVWLAVVQFLWSKWVHLLINNRLQHTNQFLSAVMLVMLKHFDTNWETREFCHCSLNSNEN